MPHKYTLHLSGLKPGHETVISSISVISAAAGWNIVDPANKSL